MYYTSNLIKKYISINDEIENIAHYLTMKTCEIEEIKKRHIPKEVVIAKVKKVYKHPDSEKLWVCELDCGEKWYYQIVTGWENVYEDSFVPVAIPGCYLPEIWLKISSRKMLWYGSDGMVCSKNELWIPEDIDKHWIWLLQSRNSKEWDFENIIDNDIGEPLIEKFPWLDNDILDVDNKTLTNRPDLTGHLSLWFDLNAIYNIENKKLIKFNRIKEYKESFSNTDIMQLLDESSKSNKQIEGLSESLRTYILLEINNISVFQSDLFMRLNMLDVWLVPRNNRVDFSNLFMYITWQPIHFFDAEKLKGNIIVRDARDWEEFVDLFGEKHILDSNDIVIADEKEILALAGVIGWINSWITEDTKNIVAEIANFDPIRVRKTAQKIWIKTDSQTRFEKNISPAYSLYVLLVFLDELKYFAKTLWKYEIGGLDYFVNQNLTKEELCLDKQLFLDFDKVDKFVFWEEKKDFVSKIKDILDWLGFEIKQDWNLKVPFFRSPDDLNLKEDVYEEIIRIYGYEKVEAKNIKSEVSYNFFSKEVWLKRYFEKMFVENFAFDQIDTYPWAKNSLLEYFNVNFNKLIELENPISVEEKFMRDSMFYNLLEVVSKNFRYFDDIKIFDDWKIWNKDFDGWEKDTVWIMVYKRNVGDWKEDNILFLKWILESISYDLKIQEKIDFSISSKEIFHPKKQGDILIGGKKIGFLWELHPFYYQYHKFPTNCSIAYLEIDKKNFSDFVDYCSNNVWELDYETLQDQIVFRDLNFLINKDKMFSDVIEALNSVEEIKDIKVFDIYSWENIPEWKKSISLEIKILWDWTFTTEDINKVMFKAIEEAQNNWAKLRE